MKWSHRARSSLPYCLNLRADTIWSFLRMHNLTQTGETERAQNDNFRSQSIAPRLA